MSMGFVLLVVGISMQLYLQPGLLRFGVAPARRSLAIIFGVAATVFISFRFLEIELLWLLPILVLLSTALLGQLWPLAVTTTIAAGAIAAINLWDLPLVMALVSGAILLNGARNERSFGFASAVAVSGDVMIVGVPNESLGETGGGTANVFSRNRGKWRKVDVLRPPPGLPRAQFGMSVGLHGSKIIVGAPGYGQAYLYHQTGNGWIQHTVFRPPEGQNVEGFGRAVSINNGVAAVAAHTAVFIFADDGGGWELRAKLASGQANDDFGAALDLGDSTLAVGAPANNTIYWYEQAHGRWQFIDQINGATKGFGCSLAVAGNRLLGGSDGAADIYRRTSNHWAHETTFTSATKAPGFGRAVALERYFAVVGAEDGGLSRSTGSVDVYADQGDVWTEHAHLTATGVDPDSQFGGAVAISNSTIVVGAPGQWQGTAYLFTRDLDRWLSGSILSQRRAVASAAAAIALLLSSMLIALFPFWDTFDSNSNGVLPLLSLVTRPLHLLLLWGGTAVLVLPMLGIAMKTTFVPGTLNVKRFGLAAFVATTPIVFWLQPFYAFPLYVVLIGLYAIHQAGYRMPGADETALGYNPRATLWIGCMVVVLGFIGDGIVNAERSITGELLAVDRLIVVMPMAIVITLALYGAWTLAHRDSEILRTAPMTAAQRTAGDALTPVLGLLALASAMVMGVELFHVVDIFAGGDYRRLNTMFKLNYQAWLLFAVLGGFALWYVSTWFNRRVLAGRVGLFAWSTVLIIGLGAVSYYPLAAVNTRVDDGNGLELNGQAHLLTTAPGEYAAIAWIKGNVPRDAVVVESAVETCSNEALGCHSYSAAGRISASTGRPTIIGWLGHERQWRTSAIHPELDTRFHDVREMYSTTDVNIARAILDRYNASYVVVGPRERRAYGTAGIEKFKVLGERVFAVLPAEQEISIYRLHPRVASW